MAAQVPHISCQRSTPQESPLELATTTHAQARRKMEDPDVKTLIWGMFLNVPQQAAVHLGNDFLENLDSTKNQ